MALRWGFASSGRIAHDFINAIGTLEPKNHRVVAVADPFISFAEDLAKIFDVPKFYGSFVELALDSEVEIVYVGALNPQHFEVALMMLEHGKHVLVEKPMCTNAKQVEKLITVAKEKNVFLMEGLWPRFLPVYQYVRQQLQNGSLGEIVSVDADFGNSAMAGFDRITKKHLGGGITLDVGVYPIQFFQMVFQREPISVKASGIINDDDVDVEVNAELTYPGNKVAKFRISALNTFENEAKISGTKGTLTVLNFIIPNAVIDIDGKEVTFPELPKGDRERYYETSRGMSFEAEAIRKCIRAGEMECKLASLDESLIIARIEDEIHRQIGVRCSADEE